MIEKLRQNYRLSNLLARLLFVATVTFALFWKCLPVAGVVSDIGGQTIPENLIVPSCVIASLLVAVAVHFLVPLACNLFLNVSRIHCVPAAEYVLLAFVCCSAGFLLRGLFALLAYFVPNVSNWVNGLAPFVLTLASGALFYKITAKMYFNDVTVVPYFKNFSVALIALAVVLGVIL